MSLPFWLIWWIWASFGLILVGLEMLLPGYIFLGFGIGAVFTGGLVGIASSADWSLPIVLLIFAGLSLVAWLVLRRIFATPTGSVQTFDTDVND